LRHIEGMTLEEIAEAMELSLATIKRVLRRASNRVSEMVAADEELSGRRPKVATPSSASAARNRRGPS
jgi:predicted DNA-binding protein (UPF0251 family)